MTEAPPSVTLTKEGDSRKENYPYNFQKKNNKILSYLKNESKINFLLSKAIEIKRMNFLKSGELEKVAFNDGQKEGGNFYGNTPNSACAISDNTKLGISSDIMHLIGQNTKESYKFSMHAPPGKKKRKGKSTLLNKIVRLSREATQVEIPPNQFCNNGYVEGIKSSRAFTCSKIKYTNDNSQTNYCDMKYNIFVEGLKSEDNSEKSIIHKSIPREEYIFMNNNLNVKKGKYTGKGTKINCNNLLQIYEHRYLQSISKNNRRITSIKHDGKMGNLPVQMSAQPFELLNSEEKNDQKNTYPNSSKHVFRDTSFKHVKELDNENLQTNNISKNDIKEKHITGEYVHNSGDNNTKCGNISKKKMNNHDNSSYPSNKAHVKRNHFSTPKSLSNSNSKKYDKVLCAQSTYTCRSYTDDILLNRKMEQDAFQHFFINHDNVIGNNFRQSSENDCIAVDNTKKESSKSYLEILKKKKKKKKHLGKKKYIQEVISPESLGSESTWSEIYNEEEKATHLSILSNGGKDVRYKNRKHEKEKHILLKNVLIQELRNDLYASITQEELGKTACQRSPKQMYKREDKNMHINNGTSEQITNSVNRLHHFEAKRSDAEYVSVHLTRGESSRGEERTLQRENTVTGDVVNKKRSLKKGRKKIPSQNKGREEHNSRENQTPNLALTNKAKEYFKGESNNNSTSCENSYRCKRNVGFYKSEDINKNHIQGNNSQVIIYKADGTNSKEYISIKIESKEGHVKKNLLKNKNVGRKTETENSKICSKREIADKYNNSKGVSNDDMSEKRERYAVCKYTKNDHSNGSQFINWRESTNMSRKTRGLNSGTPFFPIFFIYKSKICVQGNVKTYHFSLAQRDTHCFYKEVQKYEKKDDRNGITHHLRSILRSNRPIKNEHTVHFSSNEVNKEQQNDVQRVNAIDTLRSNNADSVHYPGKWINVKEIDGKEQIPSKLQREKGNKAFSFKMPKKGEDIFKYGENKNRNGLTHFSDITNGRKESVLPMHGQIIPNDYVEITNLKLPCEGKNIIDENIIDLIFFLLNKQKELNLNQFFFLKLRKYNNLSVIFFASLLIYTTIILEIKDPFYFHVKANFFFFLFASTIILLQALFCIAVEIKSLFTERIGIFLNKRNTTLDYQLTVSLLSRLKKTCNDSNSVSVLLLAANQNGHTLTEICANVYNMEKKKRTKKYLSACVKTASDSTYGEIKFQKGSTHM
ncbi:conserved Plasmodium protein, unknown function [Plasmodium ovale wallikeri]|uniref:Uncharacterized protein n=1 Tax=Plasmodium ovale wallikeri TaxID=864142 RepID=A0A1A8ZUD4_PLAOA|nr:conserved Plasmodium protein, unknown function [Plasmodium ovale wallikeri]SBT47497.1 conserved Plasmodium protein, unknown function [Plasmodium ovale wallikeri]